MSGISVSASLKLPRIVPEDSPIFGLMTSIGGDMGGTGTETNDLIVKQLEKIPATLRIMYSMGGASPIDMTGSGNTVLHVGARSKVSFELKFFLGSSLQTHETGLAD